MAANLVRECGFPKYSFSVFSKMAYSYTHETPTVQKEFIGLCQDVIRDDIVNEVAGAKYFAVLADEFS